MAITTIPWEDGSGGNIYLTYPSASGDQTVSVSSDANTGAARSKVVTFTSGVGSITRQLTVNQEAGGPQQYTITVYPSSYDTVNISTFNGITNPTRAYDSGTATSSSDYAMFSLVTGNNAESYVYWKFDLSSIPTSAVIDSISLEATAKVTTSVGTRLAGRYLQVCRGTTAVGSQTANLTTTATRYTMDVGSGWTGANINELTLKHYVQRGNQAVTSSYGAWFFGATLIITYTA